MKQRFITFFSIALFFFSTVKPGNQLVQLPSQPPAGAQALPYYSVRSQGVDAARELAGWTRHVNQSDTDCIYSTFALTAEYSRSFNNDIIAGCLASSDIFIDNDCGVATIQISGSESIFGREFGDLFADYFYLAPDFVSAITFEPGIENLVLDLNVYIGLDRYMDGLFFRIDAPLNWTRWTLGLDEVVTETGVLGYDPGYFNSWEVAPNPSDPLFPEGIGIPRSKLLNSTSSFFAGKTPFGVYGATLDPLCYSTIQGCSGNDVAICLADLQLIFGWNFLNCERYHLGVGVLARAPTGNKPNAKILFEAISGNGGHWELGGHLTSHFMLYNCEEENTTLGFYLDMNITHLFNAQQTRTFDLKNKPLSRYMLAEKLSTPVVNLGASTSATATPAMLVIPTAQFQKEFSPVANITTRTLNVSADVQVDLAAQLTYAASDGFTVDIGYNFWARSCDKFSCSTCRTSTTYIVQSGSCSSGTCPASFAENTWALKGDAYVFGFDTGNPAGSQVPPTPVALSATESKATIYAGTDFPGTGAAFPEQGQSNSAIDNPQFAYNTATGNPLYGNPLGPNSQPSFQINTSVEPIFISNADIDYAANRGMSHKVYAHISYTWQETECSIAVPYIGMGGFGEFGLNEDPCGTSCNNNNSCTKNPCAATSCNICSLSQWGAWTKLGVSF